MSAASSSWLPLPGKKPSPSRPARRAAALLWPPMTIGMLACAGPGREYTSVNDETSPSWVAGSPAHSARRAATWSSVRLPRSAKGTPMASNSSSSHPTPMPSSTRPPESWSRVATSLARMTGLRCGRIRIPVPSRIVRGGGRHEGEPDQRVGDGRVVGPGHLARVAVRVGRLVAGRARRCARPSRATRSRRPRRPGRCRWPLGVPIGPTLANITPNFIAGSPCPGGRP